MATKKRNSLASELKAARKPVRQTYTVRLLPDEIELLGKLVEKHDARGAGEVLGLLIKRAARDEGLAK